MKKSLLFFVIFITIFTQNVFSYQWEFGIRITDGSGVPVQGIWVYLYKVSTPYSELYRSAQTADVLYDNLANLVCDVNDTKSNNAAWDPIEDGAYYIKIDDKFVLLEIPETCEINCDFVIQYNPFTQEFSIYEDNRGVVLSGTQDWDKIKATFKQLKSDGTTSIGTVAIGSSSIFSERRDPPFDFYVTPNMNYLFHSDTNVIESEKYHDYSNINDVINFREQAIGTEHYTTTANFKPTFSGITIRNNLENSTIDGGTIQFEDPWLIDYEDPNHSNFRRNRGMSAPLIDRDSPFSPDYAAIYDGNTYKGVFLNQDYIDPNKPFYSVKAISPRSINLGGSLGWHKFYFQNWSASPQGNVQFQYPDNTETALVFLQDNSTVDANFKGTQLSDNPNAYENNSQRKFVRTPDGKMYITYESMGYIWVEKSTDNGQSWDIMNNGKPLDNGDGKLLAISA